MTDVLHTAPTVSANVRRAGALNAPARLAALHATRLLGGVADPVLDDLTRTICERLDVPIALVSLVDDARQHFPGLTGLGGWAGAARGTALTHSLCQHVVTRGTALVVDHLATHPLGCETLARADLGVEAYVGVPLRTADGLILGAVCAIDDAPHTWTPGDLAALSDVARTVTAEIETRVALYSLASERATRGADRTCDAAACIAQRGDRWMAVFLGLHSALAVALAPVHGTWGAAISTTVVVAGLYALCWMRRPGSFLTRGVASVALQAFCALHIHQMDGLAAMYLLPCTATAAMLVYEDWRAIWPGVLAIIAQYTAVALWRDSSGLFVGHRVIDAAQPRVLTIGLHAGIVLVQATAASYYADALRRRTIADARAEQQLRAQAVALDAQIAARDGANARVLDSEARFHALTAFSPVGIFEADTSGRLTYVNPRGQQLWDAEESELLDHGWLARVHPEDVAPLMSEWLIALQAGEEYERAFRVVLPDGVVRHIRGRAAPLRGSGGQVTGAVGTVEDVTERWNAEATLAASERRFRTVVESIDQGLVITDRDGRTLYANTRASEITGYAGEELIGQPACGVLFSSDAHADGAGRLTHCLEGHRERYEAELVRKDGTRVWIEVGAAPFRDAGGAVVGVIGVMTDASARKALEATLTRQAFEDALTGLANRVRLHARIGVALTRRADSTEHDARRPAVLLVDLDDFKTVNDSLGHQAGDRLIALVAERLLSATRGSDTVARLGGDEFAVLLGGVRGGAEATMVADRIVASLSTPFVLDAREVRVGASVGIALASEGDSADDLVRNADLALYRAKASGGRQHATFAPEMHAAVLERLELETELRWAITNRELVIHYQPIVDLRTGSDVGAEALVRWQHPARGMVSPAAFIPLAEATGLIVPLGRWVLNEACRTAAGWASAGRAAGDAAGHVPLSVSVNVSGRQLDAPGFVEDVAEALRSSGLAPERLTLEVTESVLLADLDTAIGRLDALRALGVRLALDDFGTGYSSLAYLERLPVDVLKIDRAFVSDVAAGGKRAAVTRAVVALADSLGLRTVAEGVETDVQHSALAAMGCVLGQGYRYARPLDGAAFAARQAGRPRT